MVVGRNMPTQKKYKPMGKSLISKIFIKSVIYWKNLKLGVVIAWTISIVQKKFHCHSNKPGGIQFLAPKGL